MDKIIYGNTTATPNVISDWLQNDPTKADFIKNKPYIGNIWDINNQLQQYTTPGVYSFISDLSDGELVECFYQKVYLLIVEEKQEMIGMSFKITLSQYILDCASNSIIFERIGYLDNQYNIELDDYETIWVWDNFIKCTNSGISGDVIVDQIYSPTSTNAQSGKAVAEAIANIQISGGGAQSDWNETNTESMSYIQNKPTIPTKLSDLEIDTIKNVPISITSMASQEMILSDDSDNHYRLYIEDGNLKMEKIESIPDESITLQDYATKEELSTVESIAKGRATGYVFDTLDNMNTWLENTENTSKLVLGDNLYIRATDVPDYWWDGESAQPLETQKVDLTEYAKLTNVPKSIRSLIDDTTDTDAVKYANHANWAIASESANSASYADQATIAEVAHSADTATFSDEASADHNGNVIVDTYATNAELTEAIGEALEGDY